jgi:hypothetical protein
MRHISALVIALAVASGCATASAPPRHYGVNNALPGLEMQTWSESTADSGKQLVFGRAHAFVTCVANGGVIWVHRRSPEETCDGTAPTNPVPSANAVASGWGRFPDGVPFSLGVEGVASTANEQTLCVDAWNQGSAGANLVCVAH